MDCISSNLKVKEMKQGETYIIHSNIFGDEAALTRINNVIIIGHIFENKDGSIRYSECDDNDNQYEFFNIDLYKYLNEYGDYIESLGLYNNVDIEDMTLKFVLNELSVVIYNELWGPQLLKPHHEHYFKVINTQENYNTIVKKYIKENVNK